MKNFYFALLTETQKSTFYIRWCRSVFNITQDQTCFCTWGIMFFHVAERMRKTVTQNLQK